jgi:exonuclease VII small subunit
MPGHPDFEQLTAELREIYGRVHESDAPLDEVFASAVRAVEIWRGVRARSKAASLRVSVLRRAADGVLREEPFDTGALDGPPGRE